jgi:hypothetical protein
MRKNDVLKHFDPEGGTLQKTADALGITKSAVSQWDDVIPEGMAYKIQVMTAGRLCVVVGLGSAGERRRRPPGGRRARRDHRGASAGRSK